MLPIEVRGFDPLEGVLVYSLNVKTIPNEQSKTIAAELISTATEWSIIDKIVGFGADNCPSNFGSADRGGDNYVFVHLKSNLKRTIFGLGCEAHVIHNGFNKGCDMLPHDIEWVVTKLFLHFKGQTVRTEELKTFCEMADVENKNLVNHSHTRFLTLQPAIKNIIQKFEALKSYFDTNRMSSALRLFKFFTREKDALLWLNFVENLMDLSNNHIKAIETRNDTSFSVSSQVDILNQKLKNRFSRSFILTNALEKLLETFTEALRLRK